MKGTVDGELTPHQMLLFFLLAVMLFGLPLILADHYYIDDNWRAQVAGMEWKGSGRILIEWFHQGLSFTRGAPNLFPLPLLIAMVAMAYALRSLATLYFPTPTIAACLVVLPLWYSPFFLQNLSYQYDGPAMALGVVAMIYATTWRHPSFMVQTGIAACCIAAGLSLYQMVINIYVGLCCVELIRAAGEGASTRQLMRLIVDKAVHLAAGVLVYGLTAYQFLTQERTALRTLDPGWVSLLLSDAQTAAHRVAALYTTANAWLCWAVLASALAGFFLIVWRTVRQASSGLAKWVRALACVSAGGTAVVSIPGLMFLFAPYQDGARLMMGLSSALVLVFYLSHVALTTLDARLGRLLIVPIIALLSFSFAYGRVLNLHKDYSNSVLQHVAYDVASHTGLRGVERYYAVQADTRGWLPGAEGTFSLMPVMKYVVNIDFIWLPETFPRAAGITNVSAASAEQAEAVRHKVQTGIPPTVDSLFYSIYVDGTQAYIRLKPGTDP